MPPPPDRAQDAPPADPPLRSPGRPRLHDPEDERRAILNAALLVLQRHEGLDVPVAEVLTEAGLSTRAFYRHFGSKEALIRALYERDADSFGARLVARVDAAEDPVRGLHAWVDEMLGLAFDRRRAERVSTFGSAAVQRALLGSPAQSVGISTLLAPLHRLLERGRDSGHFPDAQPDQDVSVISAITWAAIGAAQSSPDALSRQEAVDQVLRFVEGGLGCRSGR